MFHEVGFFFSQGRKDLTFSSSLRRQKAADLGEIFPKACTLILTNLRLLQLYYSKMVAVGTYAWIFFFLLTGHNQQIRK